MIAHKICFHGEIRKIFLDTPLICSYDLFNFVHVQIRINPSPAEPSYAFPL